MHKSCIRQKMLSSLERFFYLLYHNLDKPYNTLYLLIILMIVFLTAKTYIDWQFSIQFLGVSCWLGVLSTKKNWMRRKR